MPGGDRTGPLGQGPKTGGGFGLCTGNRRIGRGLGRGFGRGRAFFGGYGAQLRPYSQADEVTDLKNYAKNLEEELKEIKNEITEIEKNKK
jgi:hypothetical protein